MKKFLCIFLAAVSILSLIVPAFASDEGTEIEIQENYDIKTSTISEDFVKVFGGEFNVEDYPYNPLYGAGGEDNDDIYLITCVENNVHKHKESEMYFYIYNPTRKSIDFDSMNNKVRGAYHRLEDETAYDDYDLTFVNSENEGVLLKFKAKNFFNNLAFRQEERSYDIIGIELATEVADGELATDYGVGKRFTFRDNELGFVMQQWSEIETIDTSVNHTYYRFYGDNENKAIDLHSVYFNVPNEVVDKFDFLSAVKCMWEECEMYPILVTDNEELSKLFDKVVLTKVPSSFEPSFGYDSTTYLPTTSPVFFTGFLNYGFNADSIWVSPICLAGVINSIKYLGGSFYNADGWEEPREIVVSSEQLIAHMNEHGWDDSNFKYVDKSNFDENAKEFHSAGTVNINGYLLPELTLNLTANTIFRSILGEDDTYAELYAPLRKIESSDISLTDEEFSNKYLVNVDDVAAIKSSYSEDEAMYLLQYTITDYSVYSDLEFDDTELEDEDPDDCQTLVANLTAIRNFDLIHLDFEKNGVHTILPIVSNRTNYVPDITSPNKDSSLPTWLVILIICIVVLIAVRVYKSIKKLCREKKFEKRYLK